jgi:mannose-6-phosphate isomerase-like protein (cupin superfamily)
MKRKAEVTLFVVLFSLFVMGAEVPRAFADIYKNGDFIVHDKEKAGGGTGILYGRYAFERETPPEANPVREIAWLTLKPGDSVGFHKHEVNEDVYVIVSGTGVFQDNDGTEHQVGPGDITIATLGQSHSLSNTGTDDLVFVSVIAGKTPK